MDLINTMPIFGYNINLNHTFVYFLISVLWATIMVLVIVGFFVSNLYHTLKQNQSGSSQKTMQLQWMLFKSLAFTLCSFCVLIVIPIIILVICVVVKVGHISIISCVLIVIFSTHSLVDYAILMYSIKPYRMFCVDCLRKIKHFFIRTNKIQPILVVSVSQH